MLLPAPTPALVIRYSYLWHSEFILGREEGIKDRPCTIIAAVKVINDEKKVLVLPITHSQPKPGQNTIEIPQETKRRLKLDSEQSWVVLDEWNEFIWPGPDLRMIPGNDKKTVAYGYLPAKLFTKIQNNFINLVRSDSAQLVSRS